MSSTYKALPLFFYPLLVPLDLRRTYLVRVMDMPLSVPLLDSKWRTLIPVRLNLSKTLDRNERTIVSLMWCMCVVFISSLPVHLHVLFADYSVIVEVQARGTSHVYMFLWIVRFEIRGRNSSG